MSVYITLMQVDITPMSIDITLMQVDITPLSIDMTPLSIDMTPLSIDTTPMPIDITPMSTDITPLQVGIGPMSTDITTPSIDRTLWQTVLPAFASGRWYSGGEPGCGPTVGGRPEARKRCSPLLSSHKEVGMSRFPRTEAEIAVLASDREPRRDLGSLRSSSR
jgi:hypothetical protein